MGKKSECINLPSLDDSIFREFSLLDRSFFCESYIIHKCMQNSPCIHFSYAHFQFFFVHNLCFALWVKLIILARMYACFNVENYFVK